MSKFTLEATVRTDMGKGASRRLRREENVPAILYGAGGEPLALTLSHSELKKATNNESFYSSIIDIKVDGKTEKAVIKALQRHPYKPKISHADFQRINEKEKVHVHVPLHFIGEDAAPGVKLGGGNVSHLKNEVEVACLPKDLPEFIEVDMSAMELGTSLHLSDIALPKGVELPNVEKGNDHDHAVASIVAPKGNKDDDDTDTSGEAAEGEADKGE